MVNQAHPYFYHLKDRDGEVHSSDSGTNRRNLLRQLRRQMLGMDEPCTAEFFVVSAYREGGNSSELVTSLRKDEDGKLHQKDVL